jgi:probable rRNA maturation factor
VTVRVVGDEEMARLHVRHANVPGTTDVLTFPQSPAGEPIEADIAICVDEAARRASEFGHTAERELLLYCVHGLLHCTGFDDHTDEAYERMHAEEDRLLASVGVEPTFAPRQDASSGTSHEHHDDRSTAS